jgi:hypothetical protein
MAVLIASLFVGCAMIASDYRFELAIFRGERGAPEAEHKYEQQPQLDTLHLKPS